MTRAILAIFAVLLVSPAVAATAEVPAPAPSIRFDALTHDFGTIRGPLDEAQVASLVRLLRSWAPAADASPANATAPKR
jgi:hypothetical protein